MYGYDEIANYTHELEVFDAADPSTFKHLGSLWYVDKDHVWWLEKPIKEADAATLQLVHLYKYFNGTSLPAPSRYAKDKNHVFLDDSIVLGADPETFEYIQFVEGGYSIAFDKNHIYESENTKELQKYLSNKYGRKK